MFTEPLQDLFKQASQAFYAGKLLEAQSGFRQFLKETPDHVEALYFLGLTHLGIRNYEEGIATIQCVLQKNPDFAEAHYSIGFAFGVLGKFDDAITSFSQAVALRPNYVDAYIGLARASVKFWQPYKAILAYTNALSIRPDAICAYELANLLSQLNRFDDAIIYYQSAVSIKPDFVEAYEALGVALNQLLRFEEAIVVFEKALSICPDNCNILNHLGDTFIDGNQHERAIACYQQILSINPDYTCAHVGIGTAFAQLGRLDESLACYQHIVFMQPDCVEAHTAMGSALVELELLDQAIDSYRQALVINPEYVTAIYGLGSVLGKLKRYEEAIVHYERAISISPNFAEASWSCGLLYLLHGQFEQGWRSYEQRVKLKETNYLPQLPFPRWMDGQEIIGKKLFIQFEQGFGDAIQMVRYIPLLEALDVECWVQCPQSLIGLVRRSFPRVHMVDDVIPVRLDYCIPIMSLPLAMNTFSEVKIPCKVPYMIVDPVRSEHWKTQLTSSARATVGLVWRGNPNHRNDHNRSTTLSTYVPLITEHPEIQFVTLQKGLTQEEHALLQGHKNVRILDEELTDFDESAAVISSLDLLVTIDSAPAHLAGALGVRTWILLPFNGEWRWLLNRTDSPWYPTVKLFRQTGIGNWGELIEQINSELEKLTLKQTFVTPGIKTSSLEYLNTYATVI